MRKILAGAVVALSFAPSGVLAQERAGDAALGALSGAVVLGPVGAVAGAVIGYTTGPAIAQSWGMRRSKPPRNQRSVDRSTPAASNGAPARRAEAQGTTPQPAARQVRVQPATPSVQSAPAPRADAQGATPQPAAREVRAQPLTPSAQSAEAPSAMPPVQTLE
jgi:hypothetical protein